MLFLVDVTESDGLFVEIIRHCNHYKCLNESNNCIKKKCIHCKLYSGNKNDYSYLHSE